MTSNRDLDRQLGSWFEEQTTQRPPDGLLQRSLERVAATRQRPGWLVTDRWLSPRTTGRPVTAPAGLLVAIAVAVVAVVTGAGLFLRLSPGLIGGPWLSPPISTSTSPSSSPSPSPTGIPRAGDQIAFIRSVERPGTVNIGGTPRPALVAHTRLWIVGSDGNGLRELFPNRPADQTSVAWSPDGTRLIFSESGRLYLTDPSGSAPQVVDTGCTSPCLGDGDAAFSNDGTQLVFKRTLAPESSVIGTMDLGGGRVVELRSTAATFDERPQWSPDGKQIVFSRYDKTRADQTAVFVVDADGQNVRQLSPATLPARFPGWSPDGSRIVFTSFVDEIVGVLGKDAASHLHRDVYTVRPDGTDLRQLTNDGISSGATWTPGGRLLFSRIPLDAGNMPITSGSGLWTMDADGNNPAELMPFLGDSSDTYGGVEAAWQAAT